MAETSYTNTSDIKVNTDKLPDVETYTKKIDDATTNGLEGVNNSAAYRAGETERHFHSYEHWYGVAAVPSGETHVADNIKDNPNAAAFQVDAGNTTWGAWVQVLGLSDTPCLAGSVKYDLHRIQLIAVERVALYWFQIAIGDSGAAALASNDFTTIPFEPQSNQAKEFPVEIQMRRKDSGTKAWVRCICPGQNTATANFYIGIHEYEG